MTRIVHILHHSPSLFRDEPLYSLLQRSAWHLELARFQQKYLPRCQVECWTPERRADRVIETRVAGVKSLFFPAFGLGYQREISPSLFEHLSRRLAEFDCIFLHGSVSYFSSLLLGRFGHRVRIVVQNHGERTTLTRLCDPNARKPLDYWLRVWLERRALAKAHRLLCLNADNIEDYLRNGVPESKLVLSTMGVDLASFHPLAETKPALRSALGLPAADYYLGFVGRLAPEKQVDKLIDALAHLPSNVRLLVVGDGPLRGALMRQSGRLAAGAVHFVGSVSDRARLNRFYNACDLLVLPSKSEGFGMVLVESLAAGTNVLASDLAGPRALLGDGDCGSLSRARDASELATEIRAALASPTHPQQLVARARRYSWQSVCARHAAILAA
ncbi:MAG TPA: glycosyltransferase family 4 protein [Polyangiaceae bacterium]|nr:glycosyltransferase family 4 protein [Polyangiaceae bacterium]